MIAREIACDRLPRIHRPAPVGQLAVEAVETEAALLALAPAWSELLERSGSSAPFLTPEWLVAWWHSFGKAFDSRLLVLAARCAGRLCAIAPLVIETDYPAGVRIRIVRFLGHTMSDALDWVLDEDPGEALEALVEHLASRSDWDLLDLREFAGDSPHLEPLQAAIEHRGWKARVLPDSNLHSIAIEGDWESFYRSRFDGASRKDHRREWRRLEAEGTLRFELRSSGVLQGELLDTLAAIEREHPHAGAARPGNLVIEPARSFLRESLVALDRRGWLLAAILFCDEAPVAYFLGFRFGESHYLYATAYRRELQHAAPGKMLLIRTLQALWVAGGRSIELLRGDQPFKREWAVASRRNARVLATRDSIASRIRSWLFISALPALERRTPHLHRALSLAGREGWFAVAQRGSARLMRSLRARA